MKLINKQIADYLIYCKTTRRMSNATLRQKQTILSLFANITKVSKTENINNRIFDIWISFLTNRSVGFSSINMYNSIIIAFIHYYRSTGLKIPVNLNLISKLPESKTHRTFYTTTEIQKVINSTDFATGLIIQIMFETGMRITELTYLKCSNFNNRQIIFIGKGNKPREVYISNHTYQLVLKYITANQIVNYLWSSYGNMNSLNGNPPTTNTIRNRLRSAFKSAGFENFYPHSLRHSFATNLQLQGASIPEIKEMLGHENIATTERYLHGFDGKLQELFDKYH